MVKVLAGCLLYVFCTAYNVYAATADDSGWEISGYGAVEYRQFLQSGALAGQASGTANPSIVFEPEFYKTTDNDTLTARFFLRLDSVDDERTRFDIRQLDWLRAGEDWELSFGVSKVFWGVAESQHLVDIINQTDLVQDIDGEEKLGQPMLQFATFQSWGDLRFYYLPYFRERTFPGVKGRLRPPFVIDTNNPEYSSSAEKWHPDVALRYKHSVGAWDIGLAHFHGTSREPNFIFKEPNKITPVYEVIDQTSLDLQYTSEAWLWKLEAIGRAGHGDYFTAMVGGFEYTFYDVADKGWDVGVLAEYHRDNRGADAPVTIFDKDLFFGTRITLNDISDTAFLGGVLVDIDNRSQSYFIEASSRLTDHVTIELDARVFSNINRDQFIYSLRNDNYVQLKINYYF